MSIRVKTLLIVGFTGLLSILSLYLFLSGAIKSSYKILEEREAKENVERAVEVMRTEYNNMGSTVGDWANYDDAYKFARGENQDFFIKTNIQPAVLNQLNINVFIAIDNNGGLIFAKEYDLENGDFVEFNSNWKKIFEQKNIVQTDMEKNLSGIIMLDGKPMIIAANPILTSEGKGPIAGTMIMGRYLDQVMIESLSKIAKRPLEIENYSNQYAYLLSANNNISLELIDKNTLRGYALVSDVFGNPAIILKESLARDVYNFGLNSLNSFLIALTIFGFTLVAAIFILLEFGVLSNLLKLSKQVVEIGPKKDLSLRVSSSGKDEVGQLGLNINSTLDALEKLTKKEAYESSQRKSILETMGEGVVVTNSDKKIIYTNPAFMNLLGNKGKEIIGKLFHTTFPAFNLKGKALPQDFLEDEKAQVAKGSQIKVLLKGKIEKRAVIINTAPILVAGEKKGVVRVFHDYSADLELIKQKDDFFSIASHELRTPLTIISGNLDNIIQGYGGSKLTQTDTESMNDVITSSHRLITMINEFLNVSRLDQGRLKLNIKPISICTITDKIIEEMNPLFKEKGVTLKIICERKHANVLADEDKFRQIMVNLIGNSLKFTSSGSVTIKHGVSGNMLISEISDTGIGIAKENQKLLFQRFQQVIGRTLMRQPGGTGLGLYISREFARLMGGDMWLVKSNVNQGSTFAFSLPLEKYAINIKRKDYLIK